MKICRICKIEKDESEFYFRKDYNLYRNECKLCMNLHFKNRYLIPEIKKQKKEYSYNYYHNPKNKIKISNRTKEYQQNPIVKEKHNLNCKKYSRTEKGKLTIKFNREKNIYKYNARSLLTHLVSRGKIIKPSICTICNQEFHINKIHGHHTDYSKPLDVIWVCPQCHTNIHKELIQCVA